MIEINEYVRTDKGYIFKIDEEKKNLQIANFLDAEYGKIVKHSEHLIDLIEVGDIVNGYRVLAIEDSIYENSKRTLIYKIERENYERWIYIQEYNGRICTQDDIVEILTKEQYQANCYKARRT